MTIFRLASCRSGRQPVRCDDWGALGKEMTLDQIGRIVSVISGMLEGAHAIALGGAHAKGMADAHSDLDIYVFGHAWPDDAVRDVMVDDGLPGASDIRSWSDGGTQAGTDFTLNGQAVEIWFRDIGPVRESVIAAMAGQVRRHYVTWTPNGFYDHCILADLATIKLVSEVGHLLSPLLETLDRYPLALKARLIGHGLASARFWRGNMHMETALVRCDAYYLQSIVQQIATDLLQAVFAINETYYPGDKKVARLLPKLDKLPPNFMQRFDGVLYGSGVQSEAVWRSRCAELFALVDEVEALVADTDQVQPLNAIAALPGP